VKSKILNLQLTRPISNYSKVNAIPERPAPVAQPEPASRAVGVKHAVVAGQERRRGQRVLLRVRASIHVALQGQAATYDVATLSVNPHGAVVVMKSNLPAETHLVLEHRGTKERVGCKVARPARQTAEGFHVPLEFDSPAPGFWKIAFPAADWRPEDV
jgi:hypothetical protein